MAIELQAVMVVAAGEEFGGEQMLQAFEALEDPRSRKCTYPLQELLLVALSAVTSGADDWVGVVEVGSAQTAVAAALPAL